MKIKYAESCETVFWIVAVTDFQEDWLNCMSLGDELKEIDTAVFSIKQFVRAVGC